MVGGAAISDVTLTGSVTALSETGSGTGTITFKAKVPGESRLDIRLAGASTSAIRNQSAGYPQCVLILGDGTKRQSALHNSVKWRRGFPVSVNSAPSGRGFSRHGGLSSDGFFLAVQSARGLAPALLSIGSMSPTRLSLSIVASLQCPLPFHPARSL